MSSTVRCAREERSSSRWSAPHRSSPTLTAVPTRAWAAQPAQPDFALASAPMGARSPTNAIPTCWDAAIPLAADGDVSSSISPARFPKRIRHAESAPMSDFLVPEPFPAMAPATAPPTFAVVIPAYQAAPTVTDAVDSALGQTVPPEEIIVVDDGSTDGTADVLSPYLDRIKLLRKSNGGGASALNAAIDAASSDFIVVLDADDLYLPGRLAELRRLAIERPDLDVLSTDAFFESAGRLSGRFNDANPFPVANQRTAILRVCYLFAPAVRRRRLLEIG